MQKCRVILVDDDEDDLGLLADAMAASNSFAIVAAVTSADQLLQVLQTVDDLPDAIICDFFVPPYNAHEIYEKLQQHKRLAGITFLLLTGDKQGINNLHQPGKDMAIFAKPDTVSGYTTLCRQLHNKIAATQGSSGPA